MLKNLSIKPRLIIFFILIALVSLTIAGYLSSSQSTKALMTQSFHQLEAMRGVKKARLSSFLPNDKMI